MSPCVACRLAEHVHSGLIEIITPAVEFYPNLSNLRETFGDPMERVK